MSTKPDNRTFVYEAVEDIKCGEKVLVAVADDSARVLRPKVEAPVSVFCNFYASGNPMAHNTEASARSGVALGALGVAVEYVRKDVARLEVSALKAQNKHLHDNLTATQKRCTELLEENRALKAARDACPHFEGELVRLKERNKALEAAHADFVRVAFATIPGHVLVKDGSRWSTLYNNECIMAAREDSAKNALSKAKLALEKL